ncbi:MAG: NAD(P)-dependent oxidoreductase [Myxococcota bacterium]
MSTVAVLGTGLLGSGFAQNLLQRGETVVVWNRTASKTEALVALGATAAASPSKAVASADRVHLVLTADSAVDAVIEAALPGLKPGTYLIDHSTNRPDAVAERYERLRAAGVNYVPAPVFMSPANARDASGLMLLSATADEAATLMPILETMTGRVWHVGERADQAATLKLCGNGALIGFAGVIGDLYAVAQARGLEPSAVLELFEQFPVGNFVPYIGKRILASDNMDASFELTMARKDVRLMVETGGEPNMSALPGVGRSMDAAIEQGRGQQDYGSFAWPGRPSRS